MRPTWFSFESRLENGFRDEYLESCFLTQVYYYSENRNTWMGPRGWFPADDAFSLDLEPLKQRAEKYRERGTHFSIEAIPALAVCGRFRSVLIGQFQSRSPLGGLNAPMSMGLTLEAIAQMIEPAEKHGLFRFVAWAENLKPAELPFSSHESRSQGADRNLDWSPKPYAVNLAPVTQLIADITCRVQDRWS